MCQRVSEAFHSESKNNCYGAIDSLRILIIIIIIIIIIIRILIIIGLLLIIIIETVVEKDRWFKYHYDDIVCVETSVNKIFDVD